MKSIRCNFSYTDCKETIKKIIKYIFDQPIQLRRYHHSTIIITYNLVHLYLKSNIIILQKNVSIAENNIIFATTLGWAGIRLFKKRS